MAAVVRIVRWALVVLSVAAFQGLLAQYLAPRGVGLRWDILVVILAGLTGGVTRGILAGGIVGLVSDCLAPSFLGWGMMVKATLGGAVGMSREHLFMERIVSRWIILAAGVIAHDIVYLLPVSGFDPGLYARSLAVGTTISAAATSIVGVALLILHQSRRPISPFETARFKDALRG
jgi:cell shape-determining protein MreD